MTIKFRANQRKEIAEEISRWLGIALKSDGGDYVVDVFRVAKDGTLVFYDKVEDESTERLLEHLYDCGFETEAYNTSDEQMIQLIAGLQKAVDSLTKRIETLDKELKAPKSYSEHEREKIRKETAEEILQMLDEIEKGEGNGWHYKFPQMVLAQRIKEKFGVEVKTYDFK